MDENRKPIAGTEKYFDCDTVLFSVGLIPENELSKEAGVPLSPKTRGAVVTQTRETEIEGVFACGNALQVHDLVDFVSEEAEVAGRYAAKFVLEGKKRGETLAVDNGKNISYCCPQKIDLSETGNIKIFFRVTNTFKNPVIRITSGDTVLMEKKKKIAVPGEMETAILTAQKLALAKDKIEVSLEGEV